MLLTCALSPRKADPMQVFINKNAHELPEGATVGEPVSVAHVDHAGEAGLVAW